MSEIQHSTSPQEKTTDQRGMWVSMVVSGAYLAFLGFVVSIIIRRGYFVWPDHLFLPVVALALATSLASYFLIRKGRYEFGAGLLYIANIIPPIAAAIALQNIALVISAYILLTSYFLIYWLLHKRWQTMAIVMSAAAIIVAIVFDWRNPAFQATAAGLDNFLPYILAGMLIGFLILVLRQALGGGLRAKLLTPSLILVAVVLLSLFIYTAFTSIQAIDESEDLRQRALYDVFLGRIAAMEDFAVALATEVAANPEVQIAFANGDRDRLEELTLAAYLLIDEYFGVPQHQFHLPPATSFLRLHNLPTYGDDLSSFRFMVLAANAQKQPVQGLEMGRGGLGVRGVVPVSSQGQHIGTVEFGLNVDQTLINDMKTQYGADWQILIGRKPAEIAIFEGATGTTTGPIPELLFQASTLDQPHYAGAENYYSALAGDSVLQHLVIQGQEVAILSSPLYDFSGNIIGVVDIISDHTAVVQQQNRQVVVSLFLLSGALLVVGVGIYFNTTRTLQPIETLTDLATAIAQGDLTQKAPIESDDELGLLAGTFNTMTTQLRELIVSLEQRVAERTRALETSTEVGRRLSTILDQHELVREVVAQVQRAFDYYHAHIYLVSDDGYSLNMVGGTGEAGQTMLDRGHAVRMGQGLVGRAAETNLVVLVPDTAQAENWLPNPLLPDTKAEIAVPISIGDTVLGVLDVQDDEVDGLSQTDANLLQSIANQVAVALQNTRTYRTAQQQADREALLGSIAQRIQSTTNVEEALQVAARELGRTLGKNTSVHLMPEKHLPSVPKGDVDV